MKSQGFLFANGKVEIVSLLSSFAKFWGGCLGRDGLNVSFCGFEFWIGQRCFTLLLFVKKKKVFVQGRGGVE